MLIKIWTYTYADLQLLFWSNRQQITLIDSRRFSLCKFHFQHTLVFFRFYNFKFIIIIIISISYQQQIIIICCLFPSEMNLGNKMICVMSGVSWLGVFPGPNAEQGESIMTQQLSGSAAKDLARFLSFAGNWQSTWKSVSLEKRELAAWIRQPGLVISQPVAVACFLKLKVCLSRNPTQSFTDYLLNAQNKTKQNKRKQNQNECYVMYKT